MNSEITVRGEKFVLVVLPPGVRLYHGTATPGFDFPVVPAWFALSEERAWQWADRHDSGQPRVLRFVSASDLYLIRNDTPGDFARLVKAVTGSSVTRRWDLAPLMVRACLPGWIGNEEVMLTSVAGIEEF